MNELKYLEDVRNLVSALRVCEPVRKYTNAKASKKLSRFFRDDDNVANTAEEALSTVSLNMLSRVDKKLKQGKHIPRYQKLNIALPNIDHTVEGFDVDRVNWQKLCKDEKFVKAASGHPVTLYFLVGVNNFINSRLRRWSNENEQGNTGPRARLTKRPDQTEEDFWADVFSNAIGSQSEKNKKAVVNTLLDRGFPMDAIQYMFLYLDDVKWTEMAEEFGGSPDKYEAKVGRALKAAGLPKIKQIKSI